MNNTVNFESLFDKFLECQYERISETNFRVILPIQPLFLNTLGIVHGGIICSLADIAMGQAIIGAQDKQTVVTVDLKTTFIKGAKGNYLIAEAQVVKKGQSLNHIDCLIYDENEELVAKAYGIFANI
jgi:acyl-CoA thioesterase